VHIFLAWIHQKKETLHYSGPTFYSGWKGEEFSFMWKWGSSFVWHMDLNIEVAWTGSKILRDSCCKILHNFERNLC